MTEYSKPLPVPDLVTARFWEAAREHKLLLQRCGDCGVFQFFPQSHCRSCLSESLNWVEASGRGTIYSYTIIRRAPSAAFVQDIPYVVTLVELDEGVRMMSNVVGCVPEEVSVGMKVEVLFDHATDEIAIPKFRPAGKC